MSQRSVLFIAAALAACVLATPATASAQTTSDQHTYFTFGAPVTLPGVTLPAGKYLFRLADTANRHIVQVFNSDGSILYKTMFAIPANRLEPSEDPEVRFMETHPTMPSAVKTWWYPGHTIGHEFIYPKDQALLLAQGSGEPVLTTRVEYPGEEPADLARISPKGEEIDVVETPVPEPEVPLGPVFTGELTPPFLEMPREELPATSTVTPLVGLFGMTSLFGALMLGLARRGRR